MKLSGKEWQVVDGYVIPTRRTRPTIRSPAREACLQLLKDAGRGNADALAAVLICANDPLLIWAMENENEPY